MKVLGLTWNIESDSISLKKPSLPRELTNLTKRSIPKEMASVFDPFGLFSPVLLKWKDFLQFLWNKHIQCNHTINNGDLAAWSTESEDVSGLFDIAVKRCIAMSYRIGYKKYCLICFCDASSYSHDAAL